jgi:hypothetical protein
MHEVQLVCFSLFSQAISNKADKISQVVDQLKDQERNYMDFLLKISVSFVPQWFVDEYDAC